MSAYHNRVTTVVPVTTSSMDTRAPALAVTMETTAPSLVCVAVFFLLLVICVFQALSSSFVYFCFVYLEQSIAEIGLCHSYDTF